MIINTNYRVGCFVDLCHPCCGSWQTSCPCSPCCNPCSPCTQPCNPPCFDNCCNSPYSCDNICLPKSAAFFLAGMLLSKNRSL